MRTLAIIPARGGSKRVKNKNLLKLGHKPLINWTIDLIINLVEIENTLVTTDSVEIASHSKKAGALVPWLRPNFLAQDESSTADTVLHALDWYESEYGNVDAVMVLQPTSPFRKNSTIEAGLKLFAENKSYPVVAVSIVNEHPMWMFETKDNLLIPYMESNGFKMRSQELPPLFIVNGSFYLISPHQLRTQRSLIGIRNFPLVVDSMIEALDIDTEWDFKIAQMIIENFQKNDEVL